MGIFEIQPVGASKWQILVFTPVFNTRSPYALWGSCPTPMKAKLYNANLKVLLFVNHSSDLARLISERGPSDKALCDSHYLLINFIGNRADDDSSACTCEGSST